MKSTLSKILLAVLLLCVVTSPGCKKNESSPETKSLSDAKALWETSNISNYSFKSKMNCFCVDVSKYEITVTNKIITSVKNEQGQNIQFANKNLKTIDELFEYLQNSLEKNPYKATIIYDQTLGFPTSIYIDFDQQMIDEEIGYTISDFVKK
jgi:hypothetical protein